MLVHCIACMLVNFTMMQTSRREVRAGPCEVQATGVGRVSAKDSSGIAPSPFACENVQGPFSSPPPSAA